jgi:Tfp pilus assembly protein PilF
MYKNRHLLIGVLFLMISLCTQAQSPKKYFSLAEKLYEANNYTEAITNYTKAIELDPKYEKAYVSRALCYEKLNKKQEAVEDYRKAILLSPKEKEYYYNGGRLLSLLENYKEADQMFRKALERDKGYEEVIAEEIKVLHKTKDYTYGLQVTQMGLDVKKTAVNYFNHAVMQDSLKNYLEAEKEYKNSKYYDSKFIPAYVGLALTQVKLNKINDALTTCETALTKDPNSVDVFEARSYVYASKNDYQNALNDISKVLVTKQSVPLYKARAGFYSKLGQAQNAANDYSQALKLNDKDIESYLKRAEAYEQNQNMKAAVADYNKVAALSTGNAKAELLAMDAKKKAFDLSRETNKPEIVITSHKLINDRYIKLPGDKDELEISGYIKDASPLTSIQANTAYASFIKDSLNPKFTVKVGGLNKINEIAFIATDVYNNVQNMTFKIERTEVNKPVVVLEVPSASSDGEIFLDSNNPDIYMQGKIKDESLIESIYIDGVAASFSPTAVNPDFTSQISIANKSKITITVKDVYGNETKQDFTLNRSGAEAAANNPMGNTWVIFIENSKYQSFASLDGPAKDVTTMKAALANYKISKILHKKDMTKTEMEKFFSIELRDNVKNQNISSLVIWYAGHGKFVSPTGYWVPVDGKTDDEFSYFGINNLKASMQSYSAKLKHLLVITDACESGPSFLMAMRGAEENLRCENNDLIKSKSAQVFTSAGYELATDNSQFTKTFASTLNNNTDACIAVEKIVKKVTGAVVQAGNQAPKFGKIKDLEDEGGTFFFMKK